MEKLAQHNQSVESPEQCLELRADVRKWGNFFLRECDLSYRNQDDARRNRIQATVNTLSRCPTQMLCGPQCGFFNSDSCGLSFETKSTRT